MKILFVVENSWWHRLILRPDFALSGHDVRVILYNYNDPQPLGSLGRYNFLATSMFFDGKGFSFSCRELGQNVDPEKVIALIPSSLRGIVMENEAETGILKRVVYTPVKDGALIRAAIR